MYDVGEEQKMWSKFKTFMRECIRVFKITKKPTKEEFMTISKVAGLGILVIGLLGFLVTVVKTLLVK